MRRALLLSAWIAASACGGTKALSSGESHPMREEAGSPAAEERPGLGTAWGETRWSQVSETAFARASAHPWAELALYYNDAEGVGAQVAWRGGPGLSPLTVTGHGVTVWLADENGGVLPGLYAAGRPYVIGEHGQRYAVVLRNETG